MKREFDISSTKYEKDEKNTLYKDIQISDIIVKENYKCDLSTTLYHVDYTQDSVNSYCKKEIREEIAWEKFIVTEMEQWNGEVIFMEENSFDAILTLQEYPNKRFVKIKKDAVNQHDWKNMHEGSQFVWNFKTERSTKGTIRKKNQIFLRNELKMNMSDIQNLVEEEMKKFAKLFNDD